MKRLLDADGETPWPLTDDQREDRAVGCLLGLAVGDALGTPLEFSERDSLPALTELVGGGPFNLARGFWTDDTSMAICLAESLLARQALDPRDLLQRFVAWWQRGENSSTGECFDIGGATRAALAKFVADGDPYAGSADERSAGNGSIMRLAPVAIFHHTSSHAAVRDAVEQSRTTHAARECLDACALLARLLVHAIDGASRDELLAPRPVDVASPKVRALAAGAWREKSRDEIRSSGYVIDTLEAAMWCVSRTESFDEAVLLAVNLGDDADTVGAVTGQIAGALYGESGIRRDWKMYLAQGPRIRRLAFDLYEMRNDLDACRTRRRRRMSRCPSCGQLAGVPVAYGEMPFPDRGSLRGESVGGGCVLSEEMPKRRCLACAHGW